MLSPRPVPENRQQALKKKPRSRGSTKSHYRRTNMGTIPKNMFACQQRFRLPVSGATSVWHQLHCNALAPLDLKCKGRIYEKEVHYVFHYYIEEGQCGSYDSSTFWKDPSCTLIHILWFNRIHFIGKAMWHFPLPAGVVKQVTDSFYKDIPRNKTKQLYRPKISQLTCSHYAN